MKVPKVKYSKIIVLLIIILAVWFTEGVLQVFEVTGNEPETLIKCFFALVIGELWFMSGIKKREIDKEDKDEQRSDFINS